MKKKLDLGLSFGDSIEGLQSKLHLPTDSKVKSSENWEKEELFEENRRTNYWRLVPFYIFLAALLIVLAARAFNLEIIQGQNFLSQSVGNHVIVKIAHAPRGVIYDRNGKLLVRNIPGFRLAVRRIDLPSGWQDQIAQIAALIGKNKDDFIRTIKTSKSDSITLATDLNNDQTLSLEAKQENFPWLDIEIDPKREYLYSESMATVLGYTGEASQNDLKRTDVTPYSAGDQVGKAGIEKSFEKQLRGADGYQLVTVNAQGKSQGEFLDTQPVAGSDITLSIDADLQNFIFEKLKQLLKDSGGFGASAVVMNPKTGEVLAMVNAPSFDNNLFVNKLSQEQYNAIINNPADPLINRAIATAYPPGSTFKMVISSSGLESGVITKDTKITDTGFIKVGNTVFNNWLWLDHHRTDGSINVVRALARSNDIFFYNVGERLGVDRISEYASQFGFGRPTGVELPGEISGLVPTPSWKEKTYGKIWYPGDTVNYGIGQGYLLVTPLQLAQATAVFANGGKLIQPTLIRTNQPKIVNDKVISQDTLNVVNEGLYQDTIGDGNVGFLFNNYNIKTAGKTGSAQAGGDYKPDAWYTAYAPVDNPQIVVTVLVDRAGNGADLSAPLTKSIFNWYFSNR